MNEKGDTSIYPDRFSGKHWVSRSREIDFCPTVGISVSDFQIAGGILLFIIAIVDLIFPEKTRTFPKETMGIVPIGIPLIVGPAVLTLLLMIVHTYGSILTLLCLILNFFVVWLVFSQSHSIM